MFKNLFSSCVTVSILACGFYESNAIGVSPFSKSVVPSIDGNSVQYTLTNNFDHVIAFEIRIKVRRQKIDGTDDLTGPDDNVCTIYPRHIIVKPKSKRHCILKIVGGDPEKEKAYRVIFTQHNVNFSGAEANQATIAMEIKLQAVASLYISPAEKIRKIRVVSVEKQTTDGQDLFLIHVKNVGNTRVLTKDMKEIVLVFGKKLQIKELLAHREGVVLAGSEVIYSVTQEDMTASEAKLKEKEEKKTRSAGATKTPEQPPKTTGSNPQQPQPATETANAAGSIEPKEK
ncbi:MAG: hypothetical protein LBT67_01255 [Holosporaceae bacterium]|jgi:P pilus assembly chaperone PapD|nr:hypothetical protein [Holosporaceae bacterium]